MPLGDGRADSERLLQVVQQFSHTHQVFDMSAMARDCGTIVSAVMLGAIAGSGLLPFAREHFEAVIAGSGASATATQRGFAAAFAHVQSQEGALHTVASLMADEPDSAPPVAATLNLSSSPLHTLPASAQDLIRLGHARLVDYQGTGYAEQYLERLQTLWQAEQAASTSASSPVSPAGTETTVDTGAVTQTVARWLALWMAYDDIIRVADLKSRASRWQRVQQEVKLGDDDLLHLYEHFKPGVPEFAGLLPPAWASRLKGWDQRRQARGLPPWSRSLKVGTHTVGGWLALRLLASLRWLRPSSSRHAEEMQMIDRWMRSVLEGLGAHPVLGLELAHCGQLIKGYGTTNERGKHNLLHIIEHLAQGTADALERATAVRAARVAALRDDSGRALDAALVSHGAPARPIPVQPIRFMRKPTAGHPKA
jgi:indolepyruvate ferredoxin oxidoreductase beta subunit